MSQYPAVRKLNAGRVNVARVLAAVDRVRAIPM